ncbi:uncharacterized protein LOC141632418 [Silene latifolia]|uniref:uncharacterized protein LOC141632418 n=1 Tax=Silene latifolia TaxID=37657 RepID=UPI003D77ED60
MAVMTFSENSFSPLASASTSKAQKNTKTPKSKDKQQQNKETLGEKSGDSHGKTVETTIQRAATADTKKTVSLGELVGIPVLNLSEGGEEQQGAGWSLRKGKRNIPIMETIAEDEELAELLQFTADDVKSEVEFWSQSVYCYILGSNPPFEVIEDYVYKAWEEFGIDRVSFMSNGLFLVRFKTQNGMDALLNAGYYFFDNKPIIIKPWDAELDLVKEKVETVPVWVKLSGIPLKFWGDCLPVIAGLVGTYIRKDVATMDKTRLAYARVLVELKMDQTLPHQVKFLDEVGRVVVVKVEYEWRPVTCEHCKGLGHTKQQCRKALPKVKPKVGVKPNQPAQKKKQESGGHSKPVETVQEKLFTPDVFSPLVRLPIATPAMHIMKLNRQGGTTGIRAAGKTKPYSFLDALNGTTLRGVGRSAYGAQFIHMKVESRLEGKHFLLTMIYAHNDLYEKMELWKFLKDIALHCDEPWLWAGDFNTVLSPIERLGGNTTEAEMEHFQECVSLCCVEDLQATGALFTWSNKQDPADRGNSRLDRVMGNHEWMLEYGDYMARFHPEGIFDHCPCTIVHNRTELTGRRSFKYFNMWGQSPQFKACVNTVWERQYLGTKMYQLVKKMKELKPVLKSLNKSCFSDIENSFNLTSALLEQIQTQLVDSPGNMELMQQEMEVSQELRALLTARDSFLNKVLSIEDHHGNLCTDGNSIQQAFLDYYTELLGSHSTTDSINVHVVRRGQCCTPKHWEILNRPVTCDEIQKCLFSIPKDKAPGPDGYTSQFYKDAWDLVGEEVCAAVLNVFDSGKMLTQINATLITLIPKLDRPESVKHFRPIACCNVIYKTISKLLCNRLAAILPNIISRNQGAFIHGRSILENILICQDLVRLYNRGNCSPRCMFKLDLQKAYDSIEWSFIDQMLVALQFPEKFRKLVMLCVTTPSFFSESQWSYFWLLPW